MYFKFHHYNLILSLKLFILKVYQLFFNFFILKVSYFVSNLNDDFHEDFFEVNYVSVSQKLVILGFSSQIFFILTLVTSDTSWGQTMSLSNLNEVSNFSWRCRLLYETLFVWSVPKLQCPEIVIWHRDTLTPPQPLSPQSESLTDQKAFIY